MKLKEIITNIFVQNRIIQSDNISYDVINDLLRGSYQSFNILYNHITAKIVSINQSEYSITWQFSDNTEVVSVTIYGTINTPTPHFSKYELT